MPDEYPRPFVRALAVVLLIPFVAGANGVFILVHLLAAVVFAVVLALARLLLAVGVTPALAAVDWSRRSLARVRQNCRVALSLIRSVFAAAIGRRGPVPPRQLLSRTVLGGITRLGLLPVFCLIDLASAIFTTQPTARWASAVGLRLSHLLVARSPRSVLPADVARVCTARVHFGFFTMVLSALPCVMDNNQGILGGGLALLFGDPDWLADAMFTMRGYADYVAEKAREGELGPRARMPFGVGMIETTAAIVAVYPSATVEAMRTTGFLAGARVCWRDRANLSTYLRLFVPFSTHMMTDVRVFFTRGLLDAPEAPLHTLCELAIATSGLSDADKDVAFVDAQAVAPASIVEFEHYVGLVLPRDGTLADKAIRRSASGALLDTHTVVPSILNRHAVHVAQSTNAEACALRTFLWLYRDEARAREVSDRETTRKFGPAVSARLRAEPRYPLEPWEVSLLTAGGPRPEEEVDAILVHALRERGLHDLADRIVGSPPRARPVLPGREPASHASGVSG